MRRRGPIHLLWLLALVVAPGLLSAQSALPRTPNLSGGWVGEPGAVHFNFLHRFNLVGADDNVVTNTPTLLLAAPLPQRSLVGLQYASNSLVTSGEQNEWELFGRWAPLEVAGGAPVDLAVTAVYNEAAGSGDGEVSVAVPMGPLRILGAARAFSDLAGTGEAALAVGGGAAWRLSDGISLAADLMSASDRPDNRTVAWGAAVQVRIPLTPHTLSLQATNTRTSTLQGSSIGHREAQSDDHRIVWGFEFTIPFTFSRYFGNTGGADAADREPVEIGNGAEVTMTEDLRYAPSSIRIRAGESVVWRNTSSVVHTVTAEPDRASRPGSVRLPGDAEPFDSGEMRPGETFARTFDEPGEYVYFCVPHEAAGMVGTVVVEP